MENGGTTMMSSSDTKLLTAEEIAAKKLELKAEITPGSPAQNGHAAMNGNHRSDTPTSSTSASASSKDISPIKLNGQLKEEIDAKSSTSRNATPVMAHDVKMEDDCSTTVDERIQAKKRRIFEVAEQLANEEARYTILKKIRLSQLSTENAKKDKAESVKKATDGAGSLTAAAQKKIEEKVEQKGFKPINPAQSTLAKSTPVLSPTPNKAARHGSPVTVGGTASPRLHHPNGKPLGARDLDDVHQLAHFLATNQKMSEHDQRSAKRLVFRKQLQKTLAQCPPPETEAPDIIFFPANTSDFVNMVGLEQVVTHIKAMNSKKKSCEASHAQLANSADWAVQPSYKPPRPVECLNCGTDFSPSWHRNIDGEGVYCGNCVAQNRKRMQVRNYNKQLKSTFMLASKHEEEMQKELKKEYEKKAAAVKVEEERRRLAQKQIRDLQKQNEKNRLNQKMQQQQALKQQQELQMMMQAKRAEKQRRAEAQRQARGSSSTSTTGNTTSANNEILRQLLPQLMQLQQGTGASTQDVQKLLATVQSQLLQSAPDKQHEIIQLLQKTIKQMQEAANKKQQEEAARKRQAEVARQREQERQRRIAEERRRREQQADEKKKQEQAMAIKQLLSLIQSTNNHEQQQQLLQVLLQQAGNNREVQQKLVEQVVKLAQNQNGRKK